MGMGSSASRVMASVLPSLLLEGVVAFLSFNVGYFLNGGLETHVNDSELKALTSVAIGRDMEHVLCVLIHTNVR